MPHEGYVRRARAYKVIEKYEDEVPSFLSDPFCKNDFSKTQLRRHLPRLGVGILIYCVGLYINNLSQAWLQKHFASYYETRWAPIPPFGVDPVPTTPTSVSNWHGTNVTWEWPKVMNPKPTGFYHKDEMVTLWDVTFEYLPYVNSSGPADAFAGGSAMMALIRLAVVPGPMSLRWTFLTRAFTIWGLLFGCRAFTIAVTPLPNPYHQCVPKISFPDNIWMEALANFPGMPYNELTCQDVMFSGHTTMGTLFILFLVTYMPKAPWCEWLASTKCFSFRTFLDVVALIWCMWGWYVIAASHFHYTVDVLVGILMTSFVFIVYHNEIKTVWLSNQHPARASITPALRWLEWYSKDMRYWCTKADGVLDQMTRDMGISDDEDSESEDDNEDEKA